MWVSRKTGKRYSKKGPCPRRVTGFVEPALLLLLRQESRHGYALMEELSALGIEALPMDSSAVYRALRRLETAELVQSDWEVESTSGPPRRVYTITDQGRRRLETWAADLRATRDLLDGFLKAYERQDSPAHGSSPSIEIEIPDRTKKTGGNPMKIVVSATGPGLDAEMSPIFGRCPYYVYVDSETLLAESVVNASQNAPGGAGIQAAQTVVESGAEAVISGNIGPNALDVLEAAGLALHVAHGGTVRQVVESLREGRLSTPGSATVDAHAGMAPLAAATSDRQREIAALAQEAADLRQRLADVMARLDKLERGE